MHLNLPMESTFNLALSTVPVPHCNCLTIVVFKVSTLGSWTGGNEGFGSWKKRLGCFENVLFLTLLHECLCSTAFYVSLLKGEENNDHF